MSDAIQAIESAKARLLGATRVNDGSLKPIEKLRMMLYGTKGSGKSTFVASIPGVYFFDLTNTLGSVRSRSIQIPTWEALRAATQLVAVAKDELDIRCVAVDEHSDSWELCRKFVMQANGWGHEQDNKFKAYDLVKKEYRDWIHELYRLDVGVVLIAQTKDEELARTNKTVHRTMPVLNRNCWDISAPSLEMVWHCEKATDREGKTTHVLHTKGTQDREGKDASGRLPEDMDLNYEAVARAYNALRAADGETVNG